MTNLDLIRTSLFNAMRLNIIATFPRQQPTVKVGAGGTASADLPRTWGRRQPDRRQHLDGLRSR
jgi:hypothetical protein